MIRNFIVNKKLDSGRSRNKLFETLVQKEILLSHGLRLIYPSRTLGASTCNSLLLAAGAGVPKPPKNRFFKAQEAQNGGFGTGQGQAAGQQHRQQHGQQQGQQQGQEFQNHQKIAFSRRGKLTMVVLELVGGSSRGSS